jgi:DNA-binding transcriptional ArsR family regulator
MEKLSPESMKLNQMVECRRILALCNQLVERLDATFHVLADTTRRDMIAALADGEKAIGELQPSDMSFAAAAKHVKVLEEAGLITRRKVGRMQLCRLNARPLAQAERWLRHWELRVARDDGQCSSSRPIRPGARA